MHHELVTSIVKVVGADTATPTIPTTYPQDNFAYSTSRSGVGVYAIVCKEHFPLIIDITATVVGADGRKASITSWDEATKTINVKTWTVVGVAGDLQTTDTLILQITARESLA